MPPFDDPAVRAAFASAIDRDRLISETLNGDELPALTYTPPRHFGHVDGYATGIGHPYSPTLAADLLTASGYTGTPTITLMVNDHSYHQPIAEAVRQMWVETLGVTVTLEFPSWDSYLDVVQNGSASERPGVFRMGWRSDYPDANNWHQDNIWGGRLTRYESAAYEALVAAAASDSASATRLSLYEQAEATLVMTDTAIAPLFYSVNYRLTRPDLVRTYRSFGAQQVDEWGFSGSPRPLEVAWGDPRTLDPALGYGSTAAIDYIEQLFLGLTDYDRDTGAVMPELATGWEVSPGGLIYTFTLRSGVTWTDGTTVTAGDVKYGVLRSLDPATGSGGAWLLYAIENAQAYHTGDITDPDLVGVEAVDATHIRFTLEEPAGYFPAIVALPPALPQPQSAIDAHGDEWTDPEHIVTNGPYRLVQWQKDPPSLWVVYDKDQVSAWYPATHTLWITVTDGGSVKASAVVTATSGYFWGQEDGFETAPGDWSPGLPGITPGDTVDVRSDEGYTSTIHIGAISGTVNSLGGSVAGTVYAPWFSDTLLVFCRPSNAPWPPAWAGSNAQPDGSAGYLCQWGPEMWESEVEPGDDIYVYYEEPDGNQVGRTLRVPWQVALPLVLRNH